MPKQKTSSKKIKMKYYILLGLLIFGIFVHDSICTFMVFASIAKTSEAKSVLKTITQSKQWCSIPNGQLLKDDLENYFNIEFLNFRYYNFYKFELMFHGNPTIFFVASGKYSKMNDIWIINRGKELLHCRNSLLYTNRNQPLFFHTLKEDKTDECDFIVREFERLRLRFSH